MEFEEKPLKNQRSVVCVIEMFPKQASAQVVYEPCWKFLPVFYLLLEFYISYSTLISFLSCNCNTPETINIHYVSH